MQGDRPGLGSPTDTPIYPKTYSTHANDRCMRAPLRRVPCAVAQCHAPSDRRRRSDPPGSLDRHARDQTSRGRWRAGPGQRRAPGPSRGAPAIGRP
eukprot:1440580-Alexandrium_andersonii.AAC.1